VKGQLASKQIYTEKKGWFGLVLCHFQQYFSYIVSRFYFWRKPLAPPLSYSHQHLWNANITFHTSTSNL
jgi:hypothetical protein